MNKEDQLDIAICSGNLEECKKLLTNKVDIEMFESNRIYPLCIACENDNYEMVHLLIQLGVNVNEVDIYNQSALHYAIDNSDFEIIKLLINSGACINSFDINGIYPIHVAINRKNNEICEYLINKGSLINVYDKLGNTPLALSIVNDYFYMIYKLLELGADPNIADYNGDTPLTKAIWSTNDTNADIDQITNIVKELIKHGANVNAKNDSGRTALFTSIYQNNTEIALCLISNGASLDFEDRKKENFTLLHYSCYQGNYELVKILLEKNLDPNALSSTGETPLYISIIKGYVDIVCLLVDNKADVNINFGNNKLLSNKCTILQAAIYYVKDSLIFNKIVDKLIEGGIDLSSSDPIPLLNICLQYNKIEFAKYLLANGTPINNVENCYISALYRAYLIKNYELCKMCILAGIQLNSLQPWIQSYLNNPNEKETTHTQINRYVIRRANNPVRSSDDTNIGDLIENDDRYVILEQEDDDRSGHLLTLDEYYLEKSKQQTTTNKNSFQNIYNLIKHHYTNPLSLQELTRIQIRMQMLKIDYKIKNKIENKLNLPKRLIDYLLFKEFNY